MCRHLSVIHSYARERTRRLRQNDPRLGQSHALRVRSARSPSARGAELVKQLLKNTYDISAPEFVLCYVTGKPRRGVGPHDVALALVKKLSPEGRAKTKSWSLSARYQIPFGGLSQRSGLMTTETTCLSSIWQTDSVTSEYFNRTRASGGVSKALAGKRRLLRRNDHH
jgi:aconitate hydratase